MENLHELFERSRTLATVEQITIVPKQGESTLLIRPTANGKEVVDLEKYVAPLLSKPRRKLGSSTHVVLASFITYLKAFSTSDTVIFFNPDPDAPKLDAVINYHKSGPDGEQAHGDFRASYVPTLSTDWIKWTTADGRAMNATSFAEFLEDHIQDVLPIPTDKKAKEPFDAAAAKFRTTIASPEQLMDVVTGLKLVSEEKVEQAVRLQTGEMEFKYSQTHLNADGRKPLRVPGLFFISLPVFQQGERYLIACKLRYRLQSGQVSWSFSMDRADAIIEDAFAGIEQKIATELKLPVYRTTGFSV